MRRETLDEILVRKARGTPGVKVLLGHRVDRVLSDGARVTGVHWKSAGGAGSIAAPLTVGADGRHSLVAKQVGAEFEIRDPALRLAYYRYVSSFAGPDGSPADAAEFSFAGDEVAYVFPSDCGQTCVAISVNLSDAPRGVDLDAWFDGKIGAHSGLAERYRASRQEGKVWGCGADSNFVRIPYGPGWALLGDAGLHQDPWTGLGMDFAAQHAAFLAEAIVDGSFEDYHRRRNEHALEDYRRTVSLARDLRALTGDTAPSEVGA